MTHLAAATENLTYACDTLAVEGPGGGRDRPGCARLPRLVAVPAPRSRRGTRP
ncbi:hypothetical protein ACFQ3Z_02545 [Streptomyces nogalater]